MQRIASRLIRILLAITLLVAVTEGFSQTSTSLHKLWKKQQQAKEQGHPREELAHLATIITKAEQAHQGADYLQALTLASQNPIGSTIYTADSLFFYLKKVETNPSWRITDRGVASFLKLLLLAREGEEILWRERFAPPKVRTYTPSKLVNWSIEDLLYEACLSLKNLAYSLPSLYKETTSRYSRIIQEGAASQAISQQLLYPLLSDLASLFTAPYGVFFEATYQLYPAYHLFSPEELQLRGLEFLSLYPLDTFPTNHLVGIYAQITAEAEKLAYQTPSEPLFRLLRADLASHWLGTNEELAFLENIATDYSQVIQQEGLTIKLLLNARKAKTLLSRNRLREALLLAKALLAKYSHHPLTNQFHNICQEIEKPELFLSIETETLRPNTPIKASVQSKNVTTLEVALYQFSKEYSRLIQQGDLQQLKEIKEQIAKSPNEYISLHQLPLVYNEQFTLANDSLYHLSQSVLELSPLPLGVYVVVLSAEGLQFSCELLQISNLQAVSIPQEEEPSKVLILHKNEGTPASSATLSSYNWHKQQMHQQFQADENGLITFAPSSSTQPYNWYCTFYDRDKADFFSSPFWINSHNTYKQTHSKHVLLFTDRALYRAGQKVFFKGIAYHLQNEGKERSYQLERDTQYYVELRSYTTDQVIPIGLLKTDNYGAFAGECTLPKEILAGSYQLVVYQEKVQSPIGSTSIQLEAYKRPSMLVSLAEEYPHLLSYGATIQPIAEVNYTNGTPIQGATIDYTLTAEVGFFPQNSYTILRGQCQTTSNGRATLGELSLRLSQGQERLLQSRTGERADQTPIRYLLTLSAHTANGEIEEVTYPLYTGQRKIPLYATLPQICNKEQIASFSIYSTLPLPDSNKPIRGKYQLRTKGAPEGSTPLYENDFELGEALVAKPLGQLASGWYQLTMEASNAEFKAQGEQLIYLFSETDTQLATDTTLLMHALADTITCGEPIRLLVGSSENNQLVYLSLETQYPFSYPLPKEVYTERGEALPLTPLTENLFCLELSEQQEIITLPPAPKGASHIKIVGFALRNGVFNQTALTLVQQKRESVKKALSLEGLAESYQPGEEVTLQVKLQDEQGHNYPSQLAIWLYDKSLDLLLPYPMPPALRPSFSHQPSPRPRLISTPSYHAMGIPKKVDYRIEEDFQFDSFYPFSPSFILYNQLPMMGSDFANAPPLDLESEKEAKQIADARQLVSPPSANDTPKLMLRKDFSETALWRPRISLNDTTATTITFRLPDNVTTYRLLLYAHDQSLASYTLDTTLVVKKELTLRPNLPRYIRQGDRTTISTTLENSSQTVLCGTISLRLAMAGQETPIYLKETSVTLDPSVAKTITFALPALEEMGLATCRIEARLGRYYDALETTLPTLPSSSPILEAKPFMVADTKPTTIDLQPLFNQQDPTASHRQLVLALHSSPIWYCLETLPTLIEPASSDAPTLALSLFSTKLAQKIQSRSPHLVSILQKLSYAEQQSKKLLQDNDIELKLLRAELGAFSHIAQEKSSLYESLQTLFDSQELSSKSLILAQKLADLQGQDGGFAWLPGMPSSLYITLQTLEMLEPLAITEATPALYAMLRSATSYCLAQWSKAESLSSHTSLLAHAYALPILRQVARYMPEQLSDKSSLPAKYLHTASTAIEQLPIETLVALIPTLDRLGEKKATEKALERLKEHIVPADEGGKKVLAEPSHASAIIATQLDAIEALLAVGDSSKLAKEIMTFLLNYNRTANWGTPRNTSKALACFLALSAFDTNESETLLELDTGEKLLVSESSLNEALPPLAKKVIHLPDKRETPQQAKATKQGTGTAWGAIYATYQLPLEKLNASQSEALTLTRRLYVRALDSEGIERSIPLESYSKPLSKGDKIRVELGIESKRDYEYLIIRERKPACGEVKETRSGYHWQATIPYYQELTDSEIRYYISFLPKGTHSLSYTFYIDRVGTYLGGYAGIQALFAPEYQAHTATSPQLSIH